MNCHLLLTLVNLEDFTCFSCLYHIFWYCSQLYCTPNPNQQQELQLILLQRSSPERNTTGRCKLTIVSINLYWFISSQCNITCHKVTSPCLKLTSFSPSLYENIHRHLIIYQFQIADVWSCGVTLYVMLVGAYPFEDPEDPRNFRKTIGVRNTSFIRLGISFSPQPHTHVAIIPCLMISVFTENNECAILHP